MLAGEAGEVGGVAAKLAPNKTASVEVASPELSQQRALKAIDNLNDLEELRNAYSKWDPGPSCSAIIRRVN